MTQHEFSPLEVGEVGAWDDEYDVVVVGGGAGGTSAAIEAARAGVSTVLIESAGGPGGASALSGGFLYLGGGTSVQKACGFEDTPQAMFDFLMAASGPDPDEAKLRVYCEDSVAHFDWLVGCGLEFSPKLYTDPAYVPPPGYGLMYTGGENAYPFAETITPAARGHIPEIVGRTALTGMNQGDERSGGWALMQALTRVSEAEGVVRRVDTRLERLVRHRDDIVGVRCTIAGSPTHIRARRGVVLATGGFGADERMLRQHAPALVGHMLVGTDNDNGRGMRTAQAAGAAVRHMSAGEAAFPGDPALLFRSLALDRRGRRFINEDTYPGRTGQAALFGQSREFFLLYDDEANEEARRTSSMPPTEATWVSDDLDELAELAGMPAGALARTVAEFNEHAAQGQDPVCHKAAAWLRPLTPPYGLLDLRDATFGFFTLGGLETTIDGEVLHLSGQPIEGLYAAGRITSGVPASGYCSGASLGDSTFFGRRAGRAAARH